MVCEVALIVKGYLAGMFVCDMYICIMFKLFLFDLLFDLTWIEVLAEGLL